MDKNAALSYAINVFVVPLSPQPRRPTAGRKRNNPRYSLRTLSESVRVGYEVLDVPRSHIFWSLTGTTTATTAITTVVDEDTA